MPQSIDLGDGTTVNALLSSNLGSNGIFVAMIMALFISFLYCFLMSKNLKIKMPESVPPMVSESLSPTFAAMIIFAVVFVIRVIISYTPQGNIFVLVAEVISKPIMALGTSPWSIILAFTFMNLCWFFGIHPAPIISVYLPILMSAIISNIEAYLTGTPSASLPYLTVPLMYLAVYVGGAGNTLGLAISMLTAKSEHYKTLNKISFIPNIFNINEPFIFGVPIMLNPVFFIPMVTSSFVGGVIGLLFINLGTGGVFNPTVQLPWVTPTFVTAFLSGGWSILLMVLCCIAAHTILYYPFFKIADKRAYKAEQEQQKQVS